MTENKIDIKRYNSDDLSEEELTKLFSEKRSFQIVDIKDISSVVSKLEEMIEKAGLRCRVYTEYRTAALIGAVIPTVATQVYALASVIGIGVHNLVTLNPDYEIGKNEITSAINVLYKKG